MSSKIVVVNVSYKGVPDMGSGSGSSKDQKIEGLMGKEASGSGYFFGDGVRDLSFYYHSEDDARKTLARFNRGKGALRITGLRASIAKR